MDVFLLLCLILQFYQLASSETIGNTSNGERGTNEENTNGSGINEEKQLTNTEEDPIKRTSRLIDAKLNAIKNFQEALTKINSQNDDTVNKIQESEDASGKNIKDSAPTKKEDTIGQIIEAKRKTTLRFEEMRRRMNTFEDSQSTKDTLKTLRNTEHDIKENIREVNSQQDMDKILESKKNIIKGFENIFTQINPLGDSLNASNSNDSKNTSDKNAQDMGRLLDAKIKAAQRFQALLTGKYSKNNDDDLKKSIVEKDKQEAVIGDTKNTQNEEIPPETFSLQDKITKVTEKSADDVENHNSSQTNIEQLKHSILLSKLLPGVNSIQNFSMNSGIMRYTVLPTVLGNNSAPANYFQNLNQFRSNSSLLDQLKLTSFRNFSSNSNAVLRYTGNSSDDNGEKTTNYIKDLSDIIDGNTTRFEKIISGIRQNTTLLNSRRSNSRDDKSLSVRMLPSEESKCSQVSGCYGVDKGELQRAEELASAKTSPTRLVPYTYSRTTLTKECRCVRYPSRKICTFDLVQLPDKKVAVKCHCRRPNPIEEKCRCKIEIEIPNVKEVIDDNKGTPFENFRFKK